MLKTQHLRSRPERHAAVCRTAARNSHGWAVATPGWGSLWHRRPAGRHGFSLVELLMVIGILAFLIALTVTVIANVSSSARIQATRATIRKVSELVNHRADAFSRWIEESGQLDRNNLVGTLAWNQSGENEQIARVLHRKHLFRVHFPQTQADVDTAIYPDLNDANYDLSAEFLYWMLTEGAGFGVDLADTDFSASELADTDDDGFIELVDSWGEPLRFYRWPTRLIRPADAGDEGTADKYPIDAIDPAVGTRSVTAASVLFGGLRDARVWQSDTDYATGELVLPPTQNDRVYKAVQMGTQTSDGSQPMWETVVGTSVTDGSVEWETQLDPLADDPDDPLGLLSDGGPFSAADFESAYHSPGTWHALLIVSAGSDRALGLYEPTDTAKYGHLAQPVPPIDTDEGLDDLFDNISSRNLQAGGN